MILQRELQLHFYADQILREVARQVRTFDAALQRVANQIFSFMRGYGGIGLAAPQVGVFYRIVVFDVDGVEKCLVNPEILSSCQENDTGNEGCLSIPNRWYDVERSLKIKVRANSLQGEYLNFTVQGLAARVLQHEIDHLNGILICDHGVEITGSYRKF